MIRPSLMALESEPTTDRLLTPSDVGNRLAVSRSMVYKLLRTGELAALYVGRLPRIAERDLDAYIERQRRHGQVPR